MENIVMYVNMGRFVLQFQQQLYFTAKSKKRSNFAESNNNALKRVITKFLYIPTEILTSISINNHNSMKYGQGIIRGEKKISKTKKLKKNLEKTPAKKQKQKTQKKPKAKSKKKKKRQEKKERKNENTAITRQLNITKSDS